MSENFKTIINRYALFMAFPILLLLGQNFSLILFIYLFIVTPDKNIFFIPTHWIQVIALVFGIGAIISVTDINSEASNANELALSVLPNYLYWTIMLILLINFRSKLDTYNLSKYIFIGFLSSLIYYQLSEYIPKIPGILSSFSPNAYAFLCVTFTAPSATYLLYKKGYLYSILLILFILFTLLMAGRRAGFLLVFISSFLSISMRNISLKQVSIFISMGILLYFLYQLEFIENNIYAANPRVHELLYANEDIETTDRSLLTRKLMVEKSLIILSNHPLTGIGLNNFMNYEVDFIGDFDGSEFVMNKADMNEKNAHNSYANLLGEGGLLLIVPFFILILYNVFNFFLNFKKRSHIESTFYISLFAMCIHFYFIAALFNAYAWFIIGIVSAISSREYKQKLT